MTFREALLTATSNGDIDIVKALMGSARWKKKYLQCFFGHEVVKPKYFVCFVFSDDTTAMLPQSLLTIAAKAGFSEIVKLFLDAGADVEERRMLGVDRITSLLFIVVMLVILSFSFSMGTRLSFWPYREVMLIR